MKTRIQELRKQKGLSQEVLAEMLGVTRQTVISIEKERYVASLELAFKVSQVFDLPIEEIFLYEED